MVKSMDVSEDCPECGDGQMQFTEPSPKAGSKLVCSNLACDFEASYNGDSDETNNLVIGSLWVETDSGMTAVFQGEDPDGRVRLDFQDGNGPLRLLKNLFESGWTPRRESGCYECARKEHAHPR